MSAPGLRIATINHDMNERHTKYTYGKVIVKKNAWLGMNVTICPGVTIGEYAVVAAGAVLTKDVPDHAVVGGVPAKVIKYLDSSAVCLTALLITTLQSMMTFRFQ